MEQDNLPKGRKDGGVWEFGVLIPFHARTLEKLMRHVYLKSIDMSQIRVKFTYRVTIWAK